MAESGDQPKALARASSRAGASSVRFWGSVPPVEETSMRGSVLPALLLIGQSTLAGDESAVTVLKGHRAEIACVAFTPDGKILASGDSRTVKLWDVASKKEM